MVYKISNSRKPKQKEKIEKRGYRKKPVSEVVDSRGREASVEGQVIAPNADLDIRQETVEKFSHIVQKLGDFLEENNKKLELIECLDFKNGDNVLSIRFSKKHNRMFRIQVFLNDTTEVRPVTYTGTSTGYGFWNLLKGSLKK